MSYILRYKINCISKRWTTVNAQDRTLIRSFIKILKAVGGVMDERTYADLIYETVTEMNLGRVEVSKLLSLYVDMEKMGHLKKVADGKPRLWMLTLEGLKFADVIVP